MKHIASVSFGKDSLAMLLKLIEEKYKVDEVVFYDTGKEFQSIYDMRDKLLPMLDSNGIKFVQLNPSVSFDYKMFDKPVCKRGTKEIHKYGYSWCGATCRWGTTDKLTSIERYCDGCCEYVGLASDERDRLAKRRRGHKEFPLVGFGMTESECLDYCHNSGYSWTEKTDSAYDVPECIDLYKILDRVSCWCCRNKNLKELKAIHRYFTNSYWQQLMDMQARLPQPMKQSGSVFDLDSRFRVEILEEQEEERGDQS